MCAADAKHKLQKLELHEFIRYVQQVQVQESWKRKLEHEDSLRIFFWWEHFLLQELGVCTDTMKRTRLLALGGHLPPSH